ncbi:MAG: DUF3261 domain-containing protein [Candidatus Accumulibacter sp.]|jgi:hypothetical protein|nr:DUF3261 domain-containing protein [Accumulibacter sp.]
MIRRPRILRVLPVLLAACSGMDFRCSVLPGNVSYCLQPTAAVAPFETRQKIDFLRDGQRETMIVEIEAAPEKMRLVGLTPFGVQVIQAAYDNRVAHAEKMPETGLDPVALLSIVQAALWPLDAVRAGFGAQAAVDEKDAGRRISVDGEKIVEIAYTGNSPPFSRIKIVYPSARVVLEITTLEDNGTK